MEDDVEAAMIQVNDGAEEITKLYIIIMQILILFVDCYEV